MLRQVMSATGARLVDKVELERRSLIPVPVDAQSKSKLTRIVVVATSECEAEYLGSGDGGMLAQIASNWGNQRPFLILRESFVHESISKKAVVSDLNPYALHL